MVPSLRTVSSLAVASWLVASLPAQGPAATYAQTLDGCNGSNVGECLLQNTQPMTLVFTSQPNDYAFPVQNTTPVPLMSFWKWVP